MAPLFCCFLSVISNSQIISALTISRCNRYRKWSAVKLSSNFNLIPLLFDFSLGLGIYGHVFLSSISPRSVNSDLIFPTRNAEIFGVDSVDYSLESAWASE